MTFLTGPDSFDKNGMVVHLIGYSSTIIGRVSRSTLQAETYALSDGVEESMRLRALFLRTDCEYHTARFMRNVWMIESFLSTTISVIQRIRNALTRDLALTELRYDKWSGSLLMDSYEKKSNQISPTW